MSTFRDIDIALRVVRLAVRARGWRRGGGPQNRWPATPAYHKVFVVGCPRSGTTWVRRLLAGHPRIVTGPESHAYPQVLGTFTETGRRGITGWRHVLDRYRRTDNRGLDVGLPRWVDEPTLLELITAALADHPGDDREAADRVIRAVFDAYVGTHATSADPVLLEKTPQHLFWAEHILRRDPDARIVEVLRDGRDVCVSMEMRARTQFWALKGRAEQVATWVSYAQEGLRLRSDPTLAERMLLVRFEDVKAAPVAQAERLLHFMGLDATSEEIERAIDAVSIDRHPRAGTGRAARKGAVGDWREHFSEADVALFEREAGEVFERVGYGW